ncbi:SDR family NAD(P)-dependent oxidoreductase [Alcanivorax sp. 1008]|uniref:SDR family NAD(P)-dependent oxidoreductase n=1 Tax=Alcanivorax sp. 1008 TaxID=2816853 RepID=UPI001D42C249|nr:SDR family NAD(P)-dependent oxidoreductase [Alcanivorax sp. 1008]MCC1496684.1 SDR family NAD(P)-dependent oxidoreductase [Alcanivorax sp. 1008]
MLNHSGIAVVIGASQGIGLAMVKDLLARPQVKRVYAASRHAMLSVPLGTLTEEYGDRLQVLSLDSTQESDIASLANEVRERDQRLHWLINCAGLLHDSARNIRPEKRLEQIDMAQLEAIFRINTFAPILLAKHFLALLNHDQPACFASISARVGSISDNHLGGWYSYRASKAAQNQFIKTFAIEAERRAPNLTCLALHPGTTDTGLSKPFQKNVPQEKLFSTTFVAERLLDIVFSRPAADSGKFLAWDNSEITW